MNNDDRYRQSLLNYTCSRLSHDLEMVTGFGRLKERDRDIIMEEGRFTFDLNSPGIYIQLYLCQTVTGSGDGDWIGQVEGGRQGHRHGGGQIRFYLNGPGIYIINLFLTIPVPDCQRIWIW